MSVKRATYFLLAENGIISVDALRFLITLGVTSDSMYVGMSADAVSALSLDTTDMSTWSDMMDNMADLSLMLLLLWFLLSLRHLEKLLLKLLTNPVFLNSQ